MAACNQCGKPAITRINNHPLCVGCYALLQSTETASIEAVNDQLRLLSAQQNFHLSGIEMALGIPMGRSRVQIPERSKQQYNTVHNNVSVRGGTVGAINTGEAHSIAVAIGTSQKQGNAVLASALKDFTDALTNASVADDRKREMAEQLGALSEELAKPEEARRRAVVGPMLDGLSKAVTVSSGLVSLWQKLHPLLAHALGMPN